MRLLKEPSYSTTSKAAYINTMQCVNCRVNLTQDARYIIGDFGFLFVILKK